MATCSGASHTLAALLSLISGGLLLEWLRPEFPRLFHLMTGAASEVSRWVENAFSLQLPPRTFVLAFVTATLSFVWGVLYHIVRHRRRRRHARS
jgi:hypothetical protein